MRSMFEYNVGCKTAKVYESKNYGGYVSSRGKMGGPYEIFSLFGSNFTIEKQRTKKLLEKALRERSLSEWPAFIESLWLVQDYV